MLFYKGTWIKATRKPHTCWWCGQKIEAGSAAYYASGKSWDGDFWHGHAHAECQAALDSLPYDDEGYPEHEHGRGRDDDDRNAPPMFSADYRGRSKA